MGLSDCCKMGLFECCKKCVPPKRHAGCHSNCPDYKKCKDILEERKQVISKLKDTERVRHRRTWYQK